MISPVHSSVIAVVYKMKDAHTELQAIKARNDRVEADKAWETSLTRRGFIALLTYVCAGLYMQVMGFENGWAAALVPVGGYILSTLSLPYIKGFWLRIKRKI